MIVSSFGRYLAKTVHDHETAWREGVSLKNWMGPAGRFRSMRMGVRMWPADVG